MKIVYISRSIIPSRTANSVHVMRMCQAFANNGHEVTLLAPTTKKLEEKGIDDIFEYYGVKKNFKLKKIYTPNIKYLKKLIYSHQCFSEIKKINPDVIYGRDDIYTFFLADKKNYTAIFEKHAPLGENKFNDKLVRKMIGNENFKLVVISQALKNIYHTEYNIPLDKMFVAHDGSDMIKDEQLPSGIKLNQEIQVGYIGSLFKGRGIDIIIELAKRISNVSFHIIGGKEKDVQNWKNKVKLNNLIFHGFVQPKEAYKYRNMCDILLAPYQTDKEGNRTSEYMSPIKLFEYMASKRAMITSDLPVIREFLNENNSILVDALDINAWEVALKKLIQNKEKRLSLSRKAYDDFISHYTWQARAENILNFIKR